MPSTFFGLTIATSGLNAYQIASNTTANNVSNVQTEGYSRQVTNRVAAAALRVNAKYGTAGTGVDTVSITQERNLYYDTKYWSNNSKLGMYETRYSYSKQIENYFLDDDTTKGFTTILSTMFNYLDTLKDDAADSSVRKQFISGAESLVNYFNLTAEGLKDIQEDANSQIKATVENINSIVERISILNKQINVLEINGGYANELRDERALLVDELSQIVPTEVEDLEVPNTYDPDNYLGATRYIVSINGQKIVDGSEYEQLECVARTEKVNQSDADGLYDIIWQSTGNTFQTSSVNGGTLRALLDIRDGNNAENFSGTVSQTDTVDGATTLTITDPSVTSESELTLPDEGKLIINNKYYKYSSFTAEYNENGEIESYTFTLEEALSSDERTKITGTVASVGASVDYMGIPYYQAQLNEFLRNFCQAFNELEQGGVYLDENGNEQQMGSFWVAVNAVSGDEMDLTGTDSSLSNSYYQLTASNIAVASATSKNPLIFATSTDPLNGQDAFDIAEQLIGLKDAVMYRGTGAVGFLECIYSDIAVDTEEAKLFTENYEDMAEIIENERLSVKGVDEDDEAMDLVKFRNAYKLCSEVISILAEMYDRLILETGV